MAGEQPFFARWARMKATARSGESAPPPQAASAKGSDIPAATADRVVAARAPLPDIDALTKDSDFTVFMGADVPEGLRQEALRKLWRTDPAFAEHDGLTDYAEDYRGQAGGLVKTAYRVGRGYLDATADASDGVAEPAVPSDGKDMAKAVEQLRASEEA